MAGRPKKPHSLKVVQGTSRPDRENKNAPRPKASTPSAPSWLLDEAKAEWRRVVSELQDIGILAKIDRAMLATYCQMWGRFVEGERDNQTINASYIAQMRSLAGSFGLDPSSREKLSVAPADEIDPMEEFLNRKRK